jgi:hypothetical protein
LYGLPTLNLVIKCKRKTAKERVDVLENSVEIAPDSSGWKLRSLIGARMGCYEKPEVRKTIEFAEG